jgi:transposase
VGHTRFSRWSKKGVWESVFNQLSSDSDNEYAMLDATIVKAHQHSTGKKGIKLLGKAEVDLRLKYILVPMP